MEYKDYYKILGVDKKAAPDKIKREYRKLARKYHPDVSKHTDADNKFKEVAQNSVMEISNIILDVFFPKLCINCGEYGTYMCKNCLNNLSNQFILSSS